MRRQGGHRLARQGRAAAGRRRDVLPVVVGEPGDVRPAVAQRRRGEPEDLRRYSRSLRKRPAAASASSGRFVAATTRRSSRWVRYSPSLRISPSWSTRSSQAWARGVSSATSSRKTVLPDDSSSSPLRSCAAPVNAPLACPNSSDSNSSSPSPADLGDWPLLYDLGWDGDWSYWFARQGESTPDLSRGSGFRLYSMLTQAVVQGIGAVIGRPMLIARANRARAGEQDAGPDLRPPGRGARGCCLITTAAYRQRPEVQAFQGVGPRRGAGCGRRRHAPSARRRPWRFREPRVSRSAQAQAARTGSSDADEVRLHRPGHEYGAGAPRLRHTQESRRARGGDGNRRTTIQNGTRRQR